jgi:hypothetical protein
MHESEILNVLYIPASFLTLRYLYAEKKRYALHKLLRKDISFAGYVRTEKVFRSFWASRYQEREFRFGGLKGFLLSRIGS